MKATRSPWRPAQVERLARSRPQSRSTLPEDSDPSGNDTGVSHGRVRLAGGKAICGPMLADGVELTHPARIKAQAVGIHSRYIIGEVHQFALKGIGAFRLL